MVSNQTFELVGSNLSNLDITAHGNLPTGTVAVVVVAAGSGERLAAGVPKAFVELAGQTLLEHAARNAIELESLGLNPEANPPLSTQTYLVVVAPENYLAKAEQLARKLLAEAQDHSARPGQVDKHSTLIGYQVVAGGSTRHESVGAALAVIPDSIEHVLIHDAARALAPRELFSQVVASLRAGAVAVVPGLPVVDTIKQVTSQATARDSDALAEQPAQQSAQLDRSNQVVSVAEQVPVVAQLPIVEQVVATIDRASLRAIQTPQGFRLATLRELHRGANGDLVTDDAGLAEQAGIPVEVIPGANQAFKITTPVDLGYAQFILSARGGLS